MSQARTFLHTYRPADIAEKFGTSPAVLGAMIKAESTGHAMLGNSQLTFMAYANDALHFDASTAIYSLGETAY